MIASLALGLLGGLVVDMPPSAQVRGVELRLGDVAVISGDDEEAVRKARLLVLGQTPTPGYTRQLVRADVIRELGFLLDDVEVSLQGSPLTRVTARTQALTIEDQLGAARGALSQVFEGEDVEFISSSRVSELKVPVPRETFLLRPRTQSLRPSPGPQGVAVEVVIDGEVWRTLWTSWNVEVYELWPVLRTAVRKGETLSAAHFEPRRVRVGSGRISQPLPANAYGAAEAARTMEAGYVVLEEDVTRAWTVLAGDNCQLEVRSGNVAAQVRGRVLANGRVGDRVGVRLEDNERELVATVMAKGHLLIDLSPKPKPQSKAPQAPQAK